MRTELFKEHQKLGAKIVDFAGFEMPVQYGSVKEEVEAVRKSAGVFDVGHMGEFFVNGNQANEFVDYMLTNEFASSPVGKAVYSPLCRENGTVIDDLIAYKLEENQILICVNASNIEKDFLWFKQHVSNFDCTLTNKSDQYSLLALQGPDSEKILGQLGIKAHSSLPYYGVGKDLYHGSEIILARTGYTGEDGYEIFCSHQQIISLWNDLIQSGAKPCGLAARDVLRMEVCYPLYGHEIHDQVTPLDSALKWAVKLTKNNFLGKAALLETTPQYKLVKLSLEKGIPRENYPIYNDHNIEIGKVTSGTLSVALNKGICMAHILCDQFPENKKLFIGIRKNIVEATYHTKPFVTGGHK